MCVLKRPERHEEWGESYLNKFLGALLVFIYGEVGICDGFYFCTVS